MSQLERFPVHLPIRLGQFLKLTSLVENGAAAKEAIVLGYVLVNGVPETRRAHQLADGDVVTLLLPGQGAQALEVASA